MHEHLQNSRQSGGYRRLALVPMPVSCVGAPAAPPLPCAEASPDPPQSGSERASVRSAPLIEPRGRCRPQLSSPLTATSLSGRIQTIPAVPQGVPAPKPRRWKPSPWDQFRRPIAVFATAITMFWAYRLVKTSGIHPRSSPTVSQTPAPSSAPPAAAPHAAVLHFARERSDSPAPIRIDANNAASKPILPSTRKMPIEGNSVRR